MTKMFVHHALRITTACGEEAIIAFATGEEKEELLGGL